MRQEERRRVVMALHKRACTVLQCSALELRVNMNSEDLVELRLTRAFAARGPLNATLVGTVEEIDRWLSHKALEFGDVTRVDLDG